MENLIAPEMAIIMRFKKPFAVAGEQAASQPARQAARQSSRKPDRSHFVAVISTVAVPSLRSCH